MSEEGQDARRIVEGGVGSVDHDGTLLGTHAGAGHHRREAEEASCDSLKSTAMIDATEA